MTKERELGAQVWLDGTTRWLYLALTVIFTATAVLHLLGLGPGKLASAVGLVWGLVTIVLWLQGKTTTRPSEPRVSDRS